MCIYLIKRVFVCLFVFENIIKLRILRSSWISWVALNPVTGVFARDREDREKRRRLCTDRD